MFDEKGVVEAADYVGLRETEFRKLIADGKGPKARRDGRTLRFLPAHLDEWVEEFKKSAYTTPSKPAKAGNGKGKGRLPKELA